MNLSLFLDRARAAGVVISTAESCTGGMIAARLTDAPGSSAIFDRGFVAYSNSAKQEMLGVDPATLEANGAVSEEVAAEMAAGALARSDATFSVSVTGIAGPGGSAHKPEGLVCFGLAGVGGIVTETREFGALGRDRVRLETVAYALRLLNSYF